MSMTAEKIICENWAVILTEARKEKQSIVYPKEFALRCIVESHGFNNEEIVYHESYFKDKFGSKQLEYILGILKEIEKAEEEYRDLYYSIKEIVRRESGKLI